MKRLLLVLVLFGAVAWPHAQVTQPITAGGGISVAGSVVTANSRVLDKSTTEQDVTNTTTETSIYSFPVVGGTLGTANIVRLTLSGLFNDTGTSETLTLRVKWAGTTIASGAIAFVATANGAWGLTTTLNANGATNSQRAVTILTLDNIGTNRAVATFGIGGATVSTAYHDTLAADSTANQTLTVTAQWSTVVGSEHWKRYAAVTEVLQ